MKNMVQHMMITTNSLKTIWFNRILGGFRATIFFTQAKLPARLEN